MAEALRLLVVDDNEDDRSLYRRALAAHPDCAYVIDEVCDGDAALPQIAADAPACVLLDYSLPGRNGVEVLKRIRAEHPFVPVLMLTGQGSEAIAVAAIQHGAQNYISKAAVDPEHIHRAICIAIEHCAMERRLHEQRASLEIFTRALAHDLKEPVRTVRSFLGVLSNTEALSPQGRSYFGFVQAAAERMGALIDAVYDYARLDGSAPKSQRQRCDSAALLREARDDITELIAERKATVIIGDLPEVEGDPARLRQVFQNLMCNALRHTPHNPVVSIDAVAHADHWRFSVNDNGPGVPADQRQRIFEPFTRMSEPGSAGLGMGLAICRRIVEGHGGRIWCDAGPGGGALFQFTLPKPEPDTTSAPPPSLGIIASGGLNALGAPRLATLLVVDDNEAAIELARIMLMQSAHLCCNFLAAQSGQQALDLLAEHASRGEAIDVMLLDINMPRMDGFEVLERLGADPLSPKPAIVMCSTSSYDRDIERSRLLGAIGYLEKPPQLAKLKPLLAELAGLQLEESERGAVLRKML